MVRIGVVGLGKMGLLHAGTLNALPSCKVVAVAEKEALLVRFAKKLLPTLKFYSNTEEMLAGEHLDGVYVTTPISTHLEVIKEIASNQNRIAVFTEKPLAGTLREAREIADTSAEHKLTAMIGFQKRFSPIFQRAKQVLDSGVIGETNSFSAYSYVSGVFSEGKGWRFIPNQGGALLDLGPHLFDLLIWYFGEPTEVAGSTQSVYSRYVDDLAQGTIGFKSGVAGSFDVSWSTEGYRLPEIGIAVSGTNGRLKVTDDYLTLDVFSDVSGTKAGTYRFRKPEFNMGVDFLIGDPEYCVEDRHFIECVSEAKYPEPGFDAGLRVNQVIERVRNSTDGMGGA